MPDSRGFSGFASNLKMVGSWSVDAMYENGSNGLDSFLHAGE